MQSEDAEVRAIMRILESKFQASTSIFTAQDIGRSLVGLSQMSQSISEVQALSNQIYTKIALSELRGQPNVQFLLFGKSVRVKVPKDDSSDPLQFENVEK